MRRILWSLSAQADIFDVAEHYDKIDPALADDIMLALERSVEPLLDFPRIGGPLPGAQGLRKWRVPGTPFLLFYAVTDGAVEVRRVVHAASDWKR